MNPRAALERARVEILVPPRDALRERGRVPVQFLEHERRLARRVLRPALAERREFPRRVASPRRDLVLERRQQLRDVVRQDPAHVPTERLDAAVRRHLGVRGVVPEELRLALPRLADGPPLRNVLLAPIDDANVPELQRHHLAAEVRARVRAAVHDVELGDDADRALALRVHEARERQGVAVREVAVRRGDGEDEARLALDVANDHLANLVLDVRGLVPHGHARDAGKVHERHREHVRGTDLEADLLLAHALVRPDPAVRLRLDLLAHSLEVGEDLAGAVEELAPLRGGRVVVIAVVVRRVHELQHERAPGADLRSAGQEVAPHERLEDGGLTARLRTDDGDLRELQIPAHRVHARLTEDVLQLVHERHEAVAEGMRVDVRARHRRGRGRARAPGGATGCGVATSETGVSFVSETSFVPPSLRREKMRNRGTAHAGHLLPVFTPCPPPSSVRTRPRRAPRSWV